VVVCLGDLNGPKGGEDKFCRIAAQVGHGTVVVEDVDSNLYSAISRASHRFVMKASRELSRARHTCASLPDLSDARASIRYPFTPAHESALETPRRMLSRFLGGNAKHSSLSAEESL
jgi:hypothetical protein